jgi:prophage regulatory protein
MSDKRLIDLPEVTRKTGLKRTAIYERMASGHFPKPCKLGTASRWLESEIDQWIDQLVAERDSQKAA